MKEIGKDAFCIGNMIDEMKRLVSEENSLTGTLTSIQENIVKNVNLQQLSTNPDSNGSKQELSLRVQAYSELELLKASLLALEQMKAHTKSSKELETSADVDNLEKKLFNRQEKEQQMASEVSDYRAQYESIVQAGDVNILRQRVMDLHHMVLLCERQGTNA
ncbi:hypothetical protein AC1031_006799 [Aphanomyces cochlioides]|nr:hypothetical protein AC1031_006799 [Aphanomyces cochlioides]